MTDLTMTDATPLSSPIESVTGGSTGTMDDQMYSDRGDMPIGEMYETGSGSGTDETSITDDLSTWEGSGTGTDETTPTSVEETTVSGTDQTTESGATTSSTDSTGSQPTTVSGKNLCKNLHLLICLYF